MQRFLESFFCPSKKKQEQLIEDNSDQIADTHRINLEILKENENILPISFRQIIDQLPTDTDLKLLMLGDKAVQFLKYNLWRIEQIDDGRIRLRRVLDMVGGKIFKNEEPIVIGKNEPFFTLAVLKIPGVEFDEKTWKVNSRGELQPTIRGWKKLE